jgi:hypothetical protein
MAIFHQQRSKLEPPFPLVSAEWRRLMTDGKSLEHTGVEPDIQILPTARDLANGLDPKMAKAASLVGVQLSPQETGAMFPYEGSLKN